MIRTTLLSLTGLICVTGTLIGGCKGGESGTGYVPKKPQAIPSALVSAGQESSYLPAAVGNQWTFDSEMVQIANGRQAPPVKREITYKITEVKKADDATLIHFDIKEGEKLTDRQIWKIDGNGIYQTAMGVDVSPFSSPQPVLTFPVKEKGKFKWSGSIKARNEIRSGTSASTILGEEEVDTTMGPHKAIAIETKSELKSTSATTTIGSKVWLAPNVGIVRFRQEAIGTLTKGKVKFAVIQLMKLKHVSLKK